MKLEKISTCAPGKADKEKTKEKTLQLRLHIAEYQKMLYAEKKHSLLIILQGVDASGKDGLIAGVFSGLNPLGVNVFGFKAPTEQEAAHDFLWRIHAQCPPKGMIHIFNRSHYEEVLYQSVNNGGNAQVIKHRMQEINDFERMLRNNGTTIVKFYLHISRDEQLARLKERKNNPAKYWKHNDDDWRERRKWKKYQDAYELIFKECDKPEWNILPSDQNWYKEHHAASVICKTLSKMKLEYPKYNGKK
jgi:PPK2 family polyphosphate:nucleotide phosphotransferase